MIALIRPLLIVAPIIHKKRFLASGIILFTWSSYVYSLNIEVVPFFALEIGYPEQTRDDFLTIGTVDIDGYAGLRPNLVLNQHLTIQPSAGLGFPSVGKIFSANDVVDIPFLLFVDFVYYFHLPALFPYVLLGIGYWGHFINAPNEATEIETKEKSELIFRAALNIGMGIIFLNGLKIGTLISMEDPLGNNQRVHLWFDLDYPLFH